MKKFFAILLCAVCLVSALVLPSFATTKSDLIAAASKSHLYKYVKVAVENAARTMTITDAQAAKLLPIVQEAVSVTEQHTNTTTVKDKNGLQYSEGEISEMVGYVDQACSVLGVTYSATTVSNPKHDGDLVYKFYDQKGNILLVYDGDMATSSSGIYVIGKTEDGKVIYSNQEDDYEFVKYDEDGTAIYKYVGGGSGGSSVVKDTGAGEYQSVVLSVGAAAALTVLAGVAFVVARKKVFDN